MTSNCCSSARWLVCRKQREISLPGRLSNWPPALPGRILISSPLTGLQCKYDALFAIYLLFKYIRQVITGDFNAEPHENFIRQLLHERSYQHIDCSKAPRSRRQGGERGASFDSLTISPDVNNAAPFVDSWHHLATQRYQHRLLMQQQSEVQEVATSVDVAGNVASVEPSVVMEDGFTFPACNPIKRIDFILVRNFSVESSSSSPVVTISQSRIVGDQPTADTSTFLYYCFQSLLICFLFFSSVFGQL